MSAWIVDREHVEYLVYAAKAWKIAQAWNGEKWIDLTPREMGQILWDENVKSVSYRYPDCDPFDLPGKVGDWPYLFEVCGLSWKLNPIEVIKAVDCYDYQSCEHDGWEGSTARRICDCIKQHAIGLLPGYDDAPYGYPKPIKIRSMA